MSKIVITIVNSSVEADTIFRLLPYCQDKHVVTQRLSRMIDNMSADMESRLMTISVDAGVGGANATGALTGTAVVAGATAVVGAQTFTAANVPVGANQFAVGSSDAATMSNLANAINAHPMLVNIATANVVRPVATNVITIFSSLEGSYGNAVVLTGSGEIVASGSGTLSGGVIGSGASYQFAGLV